MKKKVVFLDAGHGGFKDNKYVTYPNKMFKHKFPCHTQDGFFFEGLFNREVVDKVYDILKKYDCKVIKVHDEIEDLPLYERVLKINQELDSYERGVVVSSHSNASPNHNARGIEVFTSKGKTSADELAEIYYLKCKKEFGALFPFRTDYSDDDPDKEANFYILKYTNCPAMLIEHLFFDNEHDVKFLLRPIIIDCFAHAQAESIIHFLQLTR
jgi:N-acetylmuramoyl-L-alanine amidase